jgi:CRP-like cAMP-binding protein
MCGIRVHASIYLYACVHLFSPDSASRKAEMKDEVTLLYKLTAFEERNTILAMRKPEPARQHVHCVNVDYLSDIQERVWELLSLGKWRYLRTRDCPFVAAGEDMTSLSVIMQGSVDVTNQTHPDQVLFTIGRMQWVGSMEFFATAGDSASSDSASSDCDAEAVERKSDADASTPPASELSSAFTYTVSETSTMPVRMLRFDQRDLRSYLLLHPSIALAFTSLIQQVTTRQFKQHLTRD